MTDRAAAQQLTADIVANIKAGKTVEKPFFHLEFDKVFPDDIYAQMVEMLPSSADYRPLPGAAAATCARTGPPHASRSTCFRNTSAICRSQSGRCGIWSAAH